MSTDTESEAAIHEDYKILVLEPDAKSSEAVIILKTEI